MTAKIYDLASRTERFAEEVIKFSKKIPLTSITRPIVSQLVRSGTSIGANYSEADDALSSKDFQHKIGICKKEARETKFWLKMVITAVPGVKREAILLAQEAKELNLIFNSILNKIRSKSVSN
ncbi:MAG: four helix bundle protein [Candidatus Berkelbacteria bacterium]|nr:four helix bundle protein [Candidatus Berkelbacteria bacterium]